MQQNGSTKSNEHENPQPAEIVKVEEGGVSKKLWDEPSPQFTLVGNYHPEERGEEFPESPNLQFKSLVDRNVCLKTKGSGRLFVPTTVLEKLCDGELRTQKLYEILAAPGLQPIPEYDSADANFPSDVMQGGMKHWDWYWKHVIHAMKPVSDYLTEKYGVRRYLFSETSFTIYATWSDIFHICQQQIEIDLIFRPTLTAECDGNVKVPATPSEIQDTKEYLKSFQLNHTASASERTPVVWILDNNIQFEDLDEEESSKCTEYCHIEVEEECIKALPDVPARGHGTRVFKFVAATSASNTKIHYINVADSQNEINFAKVAKAFEHIIATSTNENVTWINCSFTLNPSNDPSALLEAGRFRYAHEMIHKMGFIIAGAAGNNSHVTPHHPWEECTHCIIVGAEDNVTKKIAAFSSGCCNPLVDVTARGTNFAVCISSCWYKFGGTSFSTATLTGSFTVLLPLIWTVDVWKTVHDVVKKFLALTSDKKFCCGHPQNPIQWNKFNFRTAVNNLVLSGKLPSECISMISSPGSSTYTKI